LLGWLASKPRKLKDLGLFDVQVVVLELL